MKNQAVIKISVCLSVLLMLFACLTACNEAGGSGGASYSVSVGGITVTPDMDMASVLAAIKESPKLSESSACPPFTGVEKLYEFSNIKITTYSEQGKDLIMSIFLKDDSLSLGGVKIGSTVAEMETALGTSYVQSGNGLYTYTSASGAKLKCIVKNGAVVSIELVTAKADA
jgi:hypothetical protein